jgi:hypothetical protein
VNNGTSSNCSSVTYASLGTSATTSYTDTGDYTPQGTYECYQVRTRYNASWTSVNSNPTASSQLGFIVSSVSITNGGVAGKLDTGDVIVFTFNQPVQPTSIGPSPNTNTVCAANNVVLIGSTTSNGSCAAGETYQLGTMTGGTINGGGHSAATWAWSNGNQTLTVTLGAATGSTASASGTLTFNPVTTGSLVLSSTGSFHVCDTNTGGGNCLPTVTGSF